MRAFLLLLATTVPLLAQVSSVPSLMGTWEPRNIGTKAGLVAYHDFQRSNTITFASGKIASIVDLTGNGNTLAQASGGNQGYLTNDVWINNAAYFDGNNMYMKAQIAALSGPSEFYALLMRRTWSTGTRLMDGYTSDSGGVRNQTISPGIEFSSGSGGANFNLLTNTWSTFVVRFSGTSSGILVDDFYESSGNGGSGNMGGMTLAARGNNGNQSAITVAAEILCSKTNAPAEKNFLRTCLARRLNKPAVKDSIVFDGDSRTVNTYEVYTIAALSAEPITSRCAVTAIAGYTTAQLISKGASTVDVLYSANISTNICVIWAGVNDLTTAADIWANLQTYCADRHSAGWKVVLCTEIDAQDASRNAAGWHSTIWPALNALILGSGTSVADVIVDLGGDAALQDATNTTYFNADKVHLIAAGYSIAGALIEAGIKSVP